MSPVSVVFLHFFSNIFFSWTTSLRVSGLRSCASGDVFSFFFYFFQKNFFCCFVAVTDVARNAANLKRAPVFTELRRRDNLDNLLARRVRRGEGGVGGGGVRVSEMVIVFYVLWLRSPGCYDRRER